LTQEYKVRIDIELPDGAHERIERAIQKAVLTELADIDIADGYSVAMRVGDRPVAASEEEGGIPDPLTEGLDGIDIRRPPEEFLV
jgi:hypothetical protein